MGLRTDPIFLIPKKAMRVITCTYYKAHTDPLFKQLQLLKIGDIYKVKVLKFYFNLHHNKLPQEMDE